MEAEPVHVIRESIRNGIRYIRQIHRDYKSDVGRNLEDLGFMYDCSVTAETVEKIVSKLKVKSAVTVSELHILKNAIVDDPNNITVVLGCHGSLKGLVREISGTDVNKQVAAVGCCCNLALGDSKACVAIAKATGAYLIAALDNLSTEIAVSSAWALGNMAGSGARACHVLLVQGAAGRLAAAAAAPRLELGDAAVYALTHFAYQMKDHLSKENVDNLIGVFPKITLSIASCQLLFILSCHRDFELPQDILHQLLESTAVSMRTHCQDCKGVDSCCELLYLVRTLANTDMTRTGAIISNYLYLNVSVDSLKSVLQVDNSVAESLTWLLGNLYNHCNDSKLIIALIN